MNKDYEQFATAVKQFSTIIIFRRDNPDGNAYGSQLGLKEILKTNFPDKTVYAAGENAEYLNPLGRMDLFDVSLVKDALGIVVDSATSEWIDGDAWHDCQKIIKIDNHPEKEVYGDLDINDQGVSSCSELVADIAMSLKWIITPEAAQCLLIGILEGTSNFFTSSFNKKTFMTLAKLVELSPKVHEIVNRRDYATVDENQLKKYLVNHIKTSSQNTTWVYLPYRILKRYHVEPNRASAFIWLLLNFTTTEFGVMFVEYENKKVRVQFTSKTRPVNSFAAKYQGWGTKHSAGAFLTGKKQIKEVLMTLDTETF